MGKSTGNPSLKDEKADVKTEVTLDQTLQVVHEVEVENWYRDETNNEQYVKYISSDFDDGRKKFVFEAEIPPRNILLEWYKQAVYIWWKQLPQSEKKVLTKNQH